MYKTMMVDTKNYLQEQIKRVNSVVSFKVVSLKITYFIHLTFYFGLALLICAKYLEI
jgi:hypothetical protein